MDWMIQAAQLLLSLSILIVLHEMGHFIPAKWFKTRVEKFYLFFDPKFSLIKKKIGETEYGIGWLPLGGYVKISGMIDESMDKEQMKKDPEPWEFRSKPAWQRLIIMLGGVTVNVILGVLIYAMTLYVWGSSYIPTDGMPNGIYCDSVALDLGLQHGDQILTVNGEHKERFKDVAMAMVFDDATSLEVERDGSPVTVSIPTSFVTHVIESKNIGFISPALLSIVQEVEANSAADNAGLLVGDQITAVNGIETPYHQDVRRELQAHKGQSIELGIVRNNRPDTLQAELGDNGILGFMPTGEQQFDMKVQTYSFFSSFPAGIKKAHATFDNYLQQMKLIIFKPETGAYKSVGGFIAIGKAFSPSWDWERFWNFTAFLSIVLAIMNLLPIPALDGGHVMFLTYEMITRRKPHEKLMEYAQVAGMIFLLALLLFANGNDVVNLVQNWMK